MRTISPFQNKFTYKPSIHFCTVLAGVYIRYRAQEMQQNRLKITRTIECVLNPPPVRKNRLEVRYSGTSVPYCYTRKTYVGMYELVRDRTYVTVRAQKDVSCRAWGPTVSSAYFCYSGWICARLSRSTYVAARNGLLPVHTSTVQHQWKLSWQILLGEDIVCREPQRKIRH